MAGAPEVCSTGLGVVIPPAPWAPADLRDGAKTWCVEHFSENAIFAPAARGPKAHLRGPRMYTAPPHRHLLCGVARISRNALVQYSLRDRFWFSWKSGNPALSHFSQSVQFSSVQLLAETSAEGMFQFSSVIGRNFRGGHVSVQFSFLQKPRGHVSVQSVSSVSFGRNPCTTFLSRPRACCLVNQ